MSKKVKDTICRYTKNQLGFINAFLITDSLLSVYNPEVPFNYIDARSHEHINELEAALDKKIKGPHSNSFWTLVKLLKGHKSDKVR